MGGIIIIQRLIEANNLPVTTLTDGGYWTKDVVYKSDIDAAPTVDAIGVDAVAEMLRDLFCDDCACNFGGNDEWLPEVCDYADCGCRNFLEDNGCWKQFIKHFKERKTNNA